MLFPLTQRLTRIKFLQLKYRMKTWGNLNLARLGNVPGNADHNTYFFKPFDGPEQRLHSNKGICHGGYVSLLPHSMLSRATHTSEAIDHVVRGERTMFNTQLNNRGTVTVHDCAGKDTTCFIRLFFNFHRLILGSIRSFLCFTVFRLICFNREQFSNYVQAIRWLYFVMCNWSEDTLGTKLDKLACSLAPMWI